MKARVFLAASLLAFAARAEDDVEVVVTGTRTAESVQRATVKTRVVTKEEAEARGATNVAEALSGELGVQVNPGAYDFLGNPSAIQIQGFDLDRVLILEDGERVIGDVGGAIDLSSISLTDVSRIELVTGPTSALYGTNAIGGVVNIITSPPDAEGPSGRARVEGRSRRGVLLEGSAAVRHDDDWLSLDAGFRRSDGVSLRSDRPDLALPEARRHSLGIRTGTRFGKRVTLVLKGRWLRDHALGLTSQEVPGLGTYLTDLPETTDRFALQAIERLELGGGSQLSFSVAQQWVDGTSVKDRRDSPVDETRFRTQRLTSYEITATIVDGRERTWVIGARFERESLEQHLDRSEVSGTTVVERSISEVGKTNLGSAAGYAQLGWRIGRRLTLLPGVRAEEHTRFGGVVAPRLAAAARVSDQVTLRASFGRGFRAPSAKEYGFVFDHSFLGYTVVGNRDLLPETSWGVNGDVRVRPDERVSFGAGAYANWVSNLIDFQFNQQLPSAVQEYKYVNVGSARTFGVELDAVTDLSSRFRSEVGYSYLFARNDSAEEPLPSRPAHTVRAALSLRLDPGMRVDARYKAVSNAFVTRGIEAPGFHTLDLRFAKRIFPSLEGYAGVIDVLDVSRDPLRVGDQRPIAGRTFYLGVSATFPEEA
jgi:outer membrane receptor for ferrienterochelin and colicins